MDYDLVLFPSIQSRNVLIVGPFKVFLPAHSAWTNSPLFEMWERAGVQVVERAGRWSSVEELLEGPEVQQRAATRGILLSADCFNWLMHHKIGEVLPRRVIKNYFLYKMK